MYQVFGPLKILWYLIVLLVPATIIVDVIASYFSIDFNIRTITLILYGLIFLILMQPVWRCLWRLPGIGQWFSSHIFPDLNGTYEVLIWSNWNIQEKLTEAAKSKRISYDPLSQLAKTNDELMKIKLTGVISQSWFKIQIGQVQFLL